MFEKWKLTVRTFRSIHSSIRQAKADRRRYLEMPAAELAGVPDDRLADAVFFRADHKVEQAADPARGIAALNAAQKVVYTIWLFDTETNNGGVCQFFQNSSRTVTPFVSDCLAGIGADEHKKLFDGLLERRPELKRTDAPGQWTETVPPAEIEAFDEALFALPPLSELLLLFIREHLQEL